MPPPRSIIRFPRWFNTTDEFWSFTKPRAIRAEIIEEIVDYHRVLEAFVNEGQVWDVESQQRFADSVSPGAGSAWARELKTLFNLLGSAWVTSRSKVQFTDVGWELLQSSDPLKLLEHQVRKYQVGNPQLSGKLTGGISIIPHYVLLEFLLHSHPRPITKEEFTLFVLKVQKHSEIPAYLKLLDLYRSLLNGYWNQFWDDIDGGVYTKLRRVADYAARFLTLPRYLKSANGQLSIADLNEAKRILAWYKQGHDSHIAFKSRKDWFSHYGSLNSSPNSLLASDYYRKVGEIEEAVTNYREAIRKGLAPLNDSAEDYRCRINGEAAIENWLINHLDRIEPGLVLVGRQYETSSAGRIDVLALDRKSNYVVVELKRDMASDVALGQILRYLGWVRLNLSEQKPVRGFIIGKDIDRHLGYAIEAHDMLPSLCNPLRYGDLGARLKIRRTAKDCRAWVEDVGVP